MIIFALLYLGIGCLLHLMLIGQHFDWSGAATWGVILGWPFIMATLAYVIGFLRGIVMEVHWQWRRLHSKKGAGK